MQDAGKARRDVTIFCWFSFLCGIGFALVTLLLRYQIAYLLSSTEEVQLVLERFIPVYCLYLTVDCAQISMSGVLRGMGRQATGAVIYIVTLCVIGLFLSSLFTQVFDFGGDGAWIALAVGSALALVGIWYVITRVNWEKETQKAMERLGVMDKSQMEMQEMRGGGGVEEFNPFTQTSESVPLFEKQDSWRVVDNEARSTIMASVFSVAFMVFAVSIFFILR